MVQIHGDDIDEASARVVVGLLVGGSAGLMTWVVAYRFFVWALGS